MSGETKLGRPRKDNLYGGHIRAVENKIADRLPELIDNMFALAAGVLFEDTDKKGKKRVYVIPPDRQANEYLINRIMGKVPDKGPETDELEEPESSDANDNTLDP